MSWKLPVRTRRARPSGRIKQAYESLLARLKGVALPLTLLSQFLPHQYEAVRAGRLQADVDALLNEGIALALRPYMRACGVPGSQE